MGRRGPAKTPTNLVVLRGNPGHRPINKDEPKPDVLTRVPSPPAHMSKLAKNAWRAIAPELIKHGLLTKVDLRALEGYCDAYGKMRVASKVIDDKGITYTTITESGAEMVRKRPECEVYAQSLSAMKQYAQEFGLTPSARTRFGAVVKPKTDSEKESDDDFMSSRSRARK